MKPTTLKKEEPDDEPEDAEHSYKTECKKDLMFNPCKSAKESAEFLKQIK